MLWLVAPKRQDFATFNTFTFTRFTVNFLKFSHIGVFFLVTVYK